jgi:hypothetical protein
MAGLSTWRRGIVQAVAVAVVAAAFASVPLTPAAADRDEWRPRYNSWHGDDDDDQGEGYRRGGWNGGSFYFYGGPSYYYAPPPVYYAPPPPPVYYPPPAYYGPPSIGFGINIR